MAELIKLFEENPNPRQIEKIVNVLRKGGARHLPNGYGLWPGMRYYQFEGITKNCQNQRCKT